MRRDWNDLQKMMQISILASGMQPHSTSSQPERGKQSNENAPSDVC
jgi:hypothetical protein